MPISHSIDALIGNTPLLRLQKMEKLYSLAGMLLAKLEYFNPGGSIKDRAALYMLRAAESSGTLTSGATVIEPTSGNTGVGLAMLCAARGYKAIIVMPDTASIERVKLMRAYGAEVILTPGSAGMRGAVDKANALAESMDNVFIPAQFDNPENASAHFCTTGPEIWQQTQGRIDALVAGVGTGGTITGTGRYLKSQRADIRVIAVEPARSPLLSCGTAGPHGIQGIGANFVPAVLDRDVIDEIYAVTDEDAFAMMRALAAQEGVFCGISSGAVVHAATQYLLQHPGQTVAVILPDTGERYLSCI